MYEVCMVVVWRDATDEALGFAALKTNLIVRFV